MIHQNSLCAYHEGRQALSERAGLVLAWVREHGPATDRQIMSGLGFGEPNAVRPRVTELVDIGMLAEVGSVRCSVTGKTVRRVDVPRREPQGVLFQ